MTENTFLFEHNYEPHFDITQTCAYRNRKLQFYNRLQFFWQLFLKSTINITNLAITELCILNLEI